MMMIKIATPTLHTNIEHAIHVWLDLLAEEKYVEAFDYTLHDAYYKWTPVLLEKVINGYGLPHKEDDTHKYKVSKWDEAKTTGSKHYNEIDFLNEYRPHSNNNEFVIIGEVFYDLPLDGEWSDLTVTFKILQSTDFTTLELNEIHVF